MPLPIVIGPMRFASKEECKSHFQAILYRDKMDTEITGDDAVSVEALLFARPDKVEELGDRSVIRYVRKIHRHNTPCFFAELDDGSLLDISFMKFINAYPATTAA